MANERKNLRGTILAEDRRTERFSRKLLEELGFDVRLFRFETAPSGKGSAKQWVRGQYPNEVTLLRSKSYQRLGLAAFRDGDNEGYGSTKDDLDRSLEEAGMKRRQAAERIATPAPTWSIETWLLLLLDHSEVAEDESLKKRFEKHYPDKQERIALRDAARAWRAAQSSTSVPSFADGRTEMDRLDT